MGQDMPFGLKWPTEILGHCSKAQSRSMQKPVEAGERCGSEWEAVEGKRETVEGLEDVQKQVEDQKGAERGQESNSTLHIILVCNILLPSHAFPSLFFFLSLSWPSNLFQPFLTFSTHYFWPLPCLLLASI